MKPLDLDLLSDAVTYAGEWIGYQQRTRRLPGVAVAVACRERVLLERAYGVADLERGIPLSTGHRFRIASHSKMFTATGALLLQERGKLRLDDRLGQWLDWAPKGPGELGQVTVRQLLSHSAGVIRDGVDTGFWHLQQPFPDEARLRKLLQEASVVYAPNVRFKYSNFGYTLVGLVVAAASGTPYNEFVHREVVDALGLRQTGPEPVESDRELLARGHSSDRYGYERFVLPHTDTRVMSPATGFYSTVADLCAFARAHFLGNPALLTDESKREMQHEQWRVEGAETGYGLGLITYDLGGRRLVGHTGGFPGFITSTLFDPEQQLVVTVLTNAGDGSASDLSGGVLRLIDRAQEAAPGGAGLERFAGRFFALNKATDVVRFGDQVLGVDPEAANPVAVCSRLTPIAETTLRIDDAPGFASPGEKVDYTFDDRGVATAIRWAGAEMVPEDRYRDRVIAPIAAARQVGDWIGGSRADR
ncbi:MAG: serine hydrolase domain-containing protein [Candidatus Dormibacteraceae bacterium]